MFRRRQPGLAAIHPRWPKRRAPEAAAGDGAPEFGFSSHIESGVRGLLAFFGGAAQILWRFVASPHRFDRDADATGRLSRDVPPYTFLTLSTFVATSAFSALLTTVMLLWFSLVRDGFDDAQEALDLPSMNDLLRLPSTEDVITRGIPCVLLVMGVLGLLRWAIGRRSPSAGARFFRTGLYIAGFQYLLATLALALFALGWVAPGGSLASRLHVGEAGVLLLPFIGAWPALLYAQQLDRAFESDTRPAPAGRAVRAMAIAAVALCTSVATFAPELAVSWAMASREVARQAQPRPLMEAAVAAFEHVGAPQSADRVTVLVTNRAHRTLHLVRGPAWLRRGTGDDDLAADARIVGWQGGDAGVLAIEPGHDAWIVLEAATCPDTARPDCG
ncbi:MAG TPA: hypothetical protein VGM81_21155, partial [Burkholderiaceae bacterium]